jgi:hypothetical protein
MKNAIAWTSVWTGAVPALPDGIWKWTVDYIKGPGLLLIEASGEWAYSPGADCGPDGDLNALARPNGAILPAAPLGALLVKIGGSTAGTTDGTIKVAGAKAIVEIGDVSGPVFMTINDELSGLADNSGELNVSISFHQLTAVPAAPATTTSTSTGEGKST